MFKLSIWSFRKLLRNEFTKNSPNFNASSSKLSKTLAKLEEANKAAQLQEKIDENQILLVALSTVVMMAKRKQLSKEHYQWTRSYLQHVIDENGRSLPNIEGIILRLGETEDQLGINDEFRNETIAGALEIPKIMEPEEKNTTEALFKTNLVNSTPNKPELNKPSNPKGSSFQSEILAEDQL